MNLDFFSTLLNNTKEHCFTLQFIDELSEYLNNIKENITEKQVNENLTDFFSTDELIAKYKISNTFLGNFFEKCNEVLKGYDNQKDIYYVSWNNNVYDKYDVKNIYTIVKYSKFPHSMEFKIYGKDLPSNVQEGMILKKNGNKYEIDIESTKNISKKFQEVAQEIVNLQEDNMQKYRKEDNLYVVVEKCPNSVYLQDVNSNVVFEESNFSSDVSNLLCNDAVVRFKNGSYIYEDDITRGWFNSFISPDEHNEALHLLLNEPNFSKIDFEKSTFNIVSRYDNYTILGYNRNNNILKVPNKLIDYWADDNSILYYDKEDKFFYKQV